MTSLWFVIPAHGRAALTRVCLRQLRECCDTLEREGIEASAVVIADDENLETAAECGFWTVERSNEQLGRKWNDGYELACREGVTHVVPCGSDDWVHPDFVTGAALPEPDTIRCARQLVMVREDGRRSMQVRIPYEGGVGIRIIPTALFAALHNRPAIEDRNRGMDATTLGRLKRGNRGGLRLAYDDVAPWQIVDWKSRGEQLNTYRMCRVYQTGDESLDPFADLARSYPTELLDEMREVYERRKVAA